MISKEVKKGLVLCAGAAVSLCVGSLALATDISGIGSVAGNVSANLANIAKLITGGAYVAGFGFAVGAIVKFKAHKDNPTQIPIGMPIALLFIAAALIFLPSVFKATGMTMFKSTESVGPSGWSTLSGGTGGATPSPAPATKPSGA